MDYQVIWTQRSLSTLRELVDYVAGRDPDAARRLGERILAKVELIRKHPLIADKSLSHCRHLRPCFIRRSGRQECRPSDELGPRVVS